MDIDEFGLLSVLEREHRALCRRLRQAAKTARTRAGWRPLPAPVVGGPLIVGARWRRLPKETCQLPLS